MHPPPSLFSLFFFNATATTEIYTLSLHDALPIYGNAPEDGRDQERALPRRRGPDRGGDGRARAGVAGLRSEEHTSELQSQSNLVCRLLLEKKKKKKKTKKMKQK